MTGTLKYHHTEDNLTMGKFIVFEGIDGSGSSTQAQMLHEFLLSKAKKALATSEPSPGPIGNMIREIHTGRIFISDDRDKREKVLALLFAADRADHLENDRNGIIKQVKEGYYVVSTRYFLSSLAYHTLAKEDFESVYNLNKSFPPPDYTFYLDCPVECALQRIVSTRLPDINEEESNLRRVAENYKYAIDKYAKLIGPVSIIDSSRDPSVVREDVISKLSEKGII
jgi:dTMP kinase